MATQKYWMRSDGGDFLQADGAEERDRWDLRGYRVTEGPVGRGENEQVWMRAEGIEMPAKYPWGAREFWESRGWVPSTPPEPIDFTRDPRVVDVAEAPPVSEPAKSASKKESK